MIKLLDIRWIIVILAVLFFSPSPANIRAASTIEVTTNTDEINTNTQCSLREAIINANNDNQSGSTDCTGGTGNDTIIFNASTNGTNFTLNIGATGENLAADGDLDITDIDGLTITGNGETSTIIDGNAAERVIDIVSGSGTVTINSLTIQNGSSSGLDDGGGIAVSGLSISVTLNNVTLKNNFSNDNGGGFYVIGSDVPIATISFNYVTVTNNKANDIGGGLALFVNSTVNIYKSTIDSNSAGFDGGNGAGGGIYTNGYSLAIDSSTISNNSATQNGGGLYFDTDTGATLVNVTISTNSVTGGTVSTDDNGGGIYAIFSTITNNNITITKNTANNVGGGVYAGTATIEYKNSIILANTDTTAGTASDDCGKNTGTLTTNGYNLTGTSTGCTTGGTGDLTSATPANELSATLANNGSTKTHPNTHALVVGSQAIDSGHLTGTGGTATGGCLHSDSVTNTNMDARNAARGQGASKGDNGCDMGSYEYSSTQSPTAVTLKNLTTGSGNSIYHIILFIGLILSGLVMLIWRKLRVTVA